MQQYTLNEGVRFKTVDTMGVVSASNHLPSIQEYAKTLKEMNEDKMFDLSDPKNFYTVAAYASIYTKVSGQLKSIINAVDSVRSFYIVDVMLSQISDDALAPAPNEDSIVRYSSKNPKIQKELDDLKKRIGLDQLIENISPDLLAYGEYTLATKIGVPEDLEDALGKSKKKFKKQSEGITDVTDIVDQGTVISLTQDGNTEGYLVLSDAGNLEIKETADFIKFSLGGQRIRVDIKNTIPHQALKDKAIKEAFDKIPRFLRVGKSVLYPVLEKIKELQLLEKLVPATRINDLSQGNLVGMNLPDNFDLETALSAVRRMEGMINRKVNVDPQTGEISVEAILSTAGKTKILPLFGEKGSLTSMDYKSPDSSGLMGETKEIRELILDSVGIPTELVYKTDGESKSEVLKRYAKYIRKLKRLQKAISQGCKQIAFIHLANKGIKFVEEDIDVIFNNTLVEIDNLDKLEHADITVSLLSNVRDFFNEMSEEDSPYRDNVNLNKVAEYIEENLRTIGLSDAMITKKEGGKDTDKEALDIDGTPNAPKAAPEPELEEEPPEGEDDGEEKVKEEPTET